MKSFLEVEKIAIEKAIENKKKKILSVACPYDRNILSAISEACMKDVVKVKMFGDKSKIIKIIKEYKINIKDFEIIHLESDEEALVESFKLIVNKKADIFMKGIVETKLFMSIILSERSLLKSSLLTHVSIYELRNFEKLLFVSDPSILIEPSVEDKKIIIENSIEILKALGIGKPKVGIISCAEKSNPKIKSSVDALELSDYYKNDGRFNILGPIGIDIAVNNNAAAIKKVDSPVAGDVDLMVMPNLDAGNIFCKGLTYIGGFDSAGIVLGAKYPIILTSRSASIKEKYNSILLSSIT